MPIIQNNLKVKAVQTKAGLVEFDPPHFTAKVTQEQADALLPLRGYRLVEESATKAAEEAKAKADAEAAEKAGAEAATKAAEKAGAEAATKAAEETKAKGKGGK